MKNHVMNLNSFPFKMVKEGNKTLNVIVTDLFIFNSFDELYANLPLMECGYTEEDIDTASPRDMEKYYSKEMQKQYGVVGIKTALI